MTEKIGKELRISEFINPVDGKTLLIDTTAASCIGPPKGLGNLSDGLNKIKTVVDGIILNIGQIKRIGNLLSTKESATIIARSDWTNLFRKEDSFMPAREIKHTDVCSPLDALEGGANGIISYLLFGWSEESESWEIGHIAKLSRECSEISLPLIVDIRPTGYRITAANFNNSIELASAMMVEAGVDVILIPFPGIKTLETIMKFATVPILIHNLDDKKLIEECIDLGISGIVLDEKVFSQENTFIYLTDIKRYIHKTV